MSTAWVSLAWICQSLRTGFVSTVFTLIPLVTFTLARSTFAMAKTAIRAGGVTTCLACKWLLTHALSSEQVAGTMPIAVLRTFFGAAVLTRISTGTYTLAKLFHTLAMCLFTIERTFTLRTVITIPQLVAFASSTCCVALAMSTALAWTLISSAVFPCEAFGTFTLTRVCITITMTAAHLWAHSLWSPTV